MSKYTPNSEHVSTWLFVVKLLSESLSNSSMIMLYHTLPRLSSKKSTSWAGQFCRIRRIFRT
ncbi:unnamed protein product [Haemonchus placei]|uniref:Uncharacterized protein n=1 Tax=Haemonchus placei TaxID=6290 RepID=A0A0N4WBD8_HAEPC|nr:unnamed protein product [Haemonchus placei]